MRPPDKLAALPATGPMLRAQDVHKRYRHEEVLKGIDLEVASGEVLCLIGPSGSGKSTFLRCINHLERIDAGRLYVDGALVGYRERGDCLYEMHPSEICRQRADIGMVFQRFNLFPHLTVLQNVIEAPLRCGAKRRPRRSSARARCSRAWASRTRRTLIPAGSRADSSSAWRSRARWRCGRS